MLLNFLKDNILSSPAICKRMSGEMKIPKILLFLSLSPLPTSKINGKKDQKSRQINTYKLGNSS